jgi:hypothetical protein
MHFYEIYDHIRKQEKTWVKRYWPDDSIIYLKPLILNFLPSVSYYFQSI